MRVHRFGFFILAVLAFGFAAQTARAQEIRIAISGQTHAMLYPCHCPLEPDGGIARRLTLVKKLRSQYPGLLLIDSGSFFAGGLLDEYSQNPQLDMQRSRIQLAAMDLMRYDAAAISDDELNFSSAFLKDQIASTRIAFVSANASLAGVVPFVIKKVAGINIAIIGITPAAAAKKEQGLELDEPEVALKQAVAAARQRGADIIMVLSNLGDARDGQLVKNVAGIDVLVASAKFKEKSDIKIEGPVVARPVWQGRRMVVLTLLVRNKKIVSSSTEELRLSDQIPDDKKIQAMMPVCFSEGQCRKPGFVGTCLQPGSPKASCSFAPADAVGLTVISRLDCRTCDSRPVVEYLKKQVPGLSVISLSYPDKEARALVEKLGIRTLPAYVIGVEIEKDPSFASLQRALERRDNGYVVRPETSGVGFFLGRAAKPGRLDFFLSLYDKNAVALLDALREFNPEIHFLASENEQGFTAANELAEIEEDLRAVCVKQYYPGFFWSYIRCRAEHIRSSWWEDCLPGMDPQPVKACARSAQGRELLRQNLALGRELEISAGPTYLMDNQEIFSSVNAPSKEELRKIIAR